MLAALLYNTAHRFYPESLNLCTPKLEAIFLMLPPEHWDSQVFPRHTQLSSQVLLLEKSISKNVMDPVK